MSKKILSCLLSIAVLLSCFAVMTSALPTSAESVAGINLNDGVKINSVSHSSPGGTVNWSGVWNLANATLLSENIATGGSLEIVGEFETATAVTKIVLTTQQTYQQRLNGTTVSLSVDNQNWVTICTVSGYGQGLGKNVFEYELADSTVYKYIKITKGEGWAALTRCIVEAEPDTSNYVPATPVASSDDTATAQNKSIGRIIWSRYNDITWVGAADPSATKPQYSTAKLAHPTVIEKIEFTTGSGFNRARNANIYASVDGETWVKLDTMSSSAETYTTYTFTIDDTQAYNYVKLEQADDLKAYNFDAMRICVYGSEPEVSFAGVQVRDNGENSDLRFAAVIEHLDFESITYNVTATYKNAGTETVTEVYTDVILKAFDSITAIVEGNPTNITAETLGGKYIITVVAKGIADSVGEVEFKIEFTAVNLDGTVSTTAANYVTFNAGTVLEIK